jgi:uncharacterized protein YggT (Ycf19 family)
MRMNLATKIAGRRPIVWLCGAVWALLLARLLARLLAARAENATITVLYWLTEPLVAPLSRFDQGQPPFGAILELSTGILILALPVVAYVLWWGFGRLART